MLKLFGIIATFLIELVLLACWVFLFSEGEYVAAGLFMLGFILVIKWETA